MVDANNNNDFSDDVPFIPLDDSTSDSEIEKHLLTVNCQRVLNGKLINDRVALLIVKNHSILKFSVAQYATAILDIRNEKYKLAICPIYFHSRSWKETQMVLLIDSLKTKKAALNLIVNDDGFITIGNETYKYEGVEINKNLLTLEKVSNNNQYSSQIGYHAPLFKSTDLLTGKNLSLFSFNGGKYVLLDFWGTWCKPCREQIPSLVKLYKIVDTSRFALLSIASSDNIDSLKKVIAKENMTWPQMFSDKITSNYHVNAFPTNLLINPNGVVIAKDLTMDDLKQKLSKLALLGN